MNIKSMDMKNMDMKNNVNSECRLDRIVNIIRYK